MARDGHGRFGTWPSVWATRTETNAADEVQTTMAKPRFHLARLLPAALRNVAFTRLWLSTLITGFGSSMTFIALPLVAYDRSGDGHAFALVMLGGSVGRLIALPIGGVLADRFDRLRILVFGEAAMLVLVGAIAATVFTEWWVGVALAQLAMNLAGSLVQPAGPALRNDIVAVAHREQSNSLMALGGSIGILLGPTVGSAIYAVWGFTTIVAVDAASYAIGMVLLLGVRRHVSSPPPAEVRESARGVGAMLRTTTGDVRIAAAAARRDPFIVAVLGGSVALGFTNGFLMTSLVPWLVETIGAPSAIVGPAIATVGVSGLISGAVLTAAGSRIDQIRLVRMMALVFLAAALPLFFRVSVPVVFAVFAAIGLAEVAVNTAVTTITQRRVPPGLQGRIHSFLQLCFVMSNVVAIALCSALIDVIPAQGLMSISAVAWLVYVPCLWAAAGFSSQPAPLVNTAVDVVESPFTAYGVAAADDAHDAELATSR